MGRGSTRSTCASVRRRWGAAWRCCRAFLVEEELAEGKLVIPWQHGVPSQDAYYLAYPEHSAEVPKVREFVKWMMEQVL